MPATLSITGSATRAIRRDISPVFRGAALTITCTITATNITGWGVSFIVRPKGATTEAVVTMSVGYGVTLATPTTGVLTIALTADDTDIDPGVYDYSLSRTTSGSETELAYGDFVMRPSQVLGSRT